MSGFESNDKAMKKLAQDVANDVGKKIQAELDRIARSNKGKPVPEVKRQVVQAMKRTGVDAPDATATGYATAVSEGTRDLVFLRRSVLLALHLDGDCRAARHPGSGCCFLSGDLSVAVAGW